MAQYPDFVTHTCVQYLHPLLLKILNIFRLGNLEPSTIVTYMFKLTHSLSSSYDVLRVVGAPEGPDVSKARAALYDAARQVIGNGIRLLGLYPVARYAHMMPSTLLDTYIALGCEYTLSKVNPLSVRGRVRSIGITDDAARPIAQLFRPKLVGKSQRASQFPQASAAAPYHTVSSERSPWYR